ncbi:MAG: nodulation protein NfeD [Nitriliruptorales bacterium]|nr:nodulation protein NfeD [Nitriliruptorales bacterium]
MSAVASPTLPVRARRLVTLLALLLALAALTLSPSAAAAQTEGAVLRAEVRGPITPVIAEHIRDALEEATTAGHQALLVEMDTPGGLETSMKQIVQDFLTAEVPVIVHVSPSGAQAASAGAIITFAANIAAMAPGTNIGAATPIGLEDGEVLDKIVNNSAAYAEAIAEVRGRDAEFAVEAVRDGRSAAANEALEVGAVDLIATNRTALLADIDGQTVIVDPESADNPDGSGTEVTLATAGAPVVDYELSFTRRVLQTLADPNLAMLFLSIGTLGVIYELATPGGIVGGVIGAIMLVLAFVSLAVLPVDLAGLLLLLLALALFAAELFVPGIGAFAGAGAVTLVVAGLFLFERPTGISVDLSFLLPVAGAVALIAVFIGRLVWRTHRRAPSPERMGKLVGAVGRVRQGNQVFVKGALWKARPVDGELHAGEEVEVLDMDGLELVVTRAHDRLER